MTKSTSKELALYVKKSSVRKSSPLKSTAKKLISKKLILKKSGSRELILKKTYKKKTLPPVGGQTFENWGGYRVKCVPLRLVNIINNLTDSQKRALSDIGFDGLLRLSITKIPSLIVPWFVDGFKDGSLMFKLNCTTPKEFLVSKMDVHDCFLLPYGPKEIEIVATGRAKLSSQPETLSFKGSWRSKYNVSGNDGIPLATIYERLSQSVEGDNDFKQNFVLFAMSTFLAPTSNAYVDLKILKAVEDVDMICQFDWCTYILSSLSEACQVFGSNPTQKKNLCGCLLVLMLSYFHRFDFKGKSCPFTLPLIQHWDDKSLEERVNAEISTGSLGNAPPSSKIYPISENNPVISRCAPVLEKVNTNVPEERKLMKKKFIMIEIPDELDDDDEIHSKATNEAHERLLMMKRDAVMFHSRFEAHYAAMTDKLSKQHYESSKPDASPTHLTPTQAFFSDPEVIRYVDEVVEMVMAMRNPSCRRTTVDEPDKRTCDLMSRKDQSGLEDLGIETEDRIEASIATVLGNLRNNHQIDDFTAINEIADNIPLSRASFHPFLLHSDRQLSCMTVVPEKQLAEVFRKSGIEKIDPTNEPFDPNRDNAVFQVPDNSKPPGTVAVVLKAGYKLHDRIIRPAEVGVTVAAENNS